MKDCAKYQEGLTKASQSNLELHKVSQYLFSNFIISGVESNRTSYMSLYMSIFFGQLYGSSGPILKFTYPMPLLQGTIVFQAMNTHINNLKLLRSQPDELKQALPEVGRDRGTSLYHV